MKKVSVIIPFLNEKDLLKQTVHSIRETAGNNVEILLINDFSDDDYDYKSIASEYNTNYIKNQERKGAHFSKNMAVKSINTDYFIIMDAHTKVFDNNWWKRIIEYLNNDERAFYSFGLTMVCSENDEKYTTYGARIEFNPSKAYSSLTTSPVLNFKSAEVPCLYGSVIAGSKKYWNYLKGLDGLRVYGLDDINISLKTWLEGGKCILIDDIEIIHYCRDFFPFYVSYKDILYNKILICETLLPQDVKTNIYNRLRGEEGICFHEVLQRIIENREKINFLKDYYKGIFGKSFDYYLALNNLNI